MEHPSIKQVVMSSPIVLALGGASITWQYIWWNHLHPIYAIEAFLLVWLGYRSFQSNAVLFFSYERHLALTLLFTCFYLSGFPAYTVVAGILLLFYRWPHRFALRSIPLVKNLSITIAWVCCTTAVAIDPSLDFTQWLLPDAALIFGLSILSDARDAQADRGHITTVAHWLGVPCTLVLSGLALVFFVQQRVASLSVDNAWLGVALVSPYLFCLGYRLRKGRALTLWIDSGAAVFPSLVILYMHLFH